MASTGARGTALVLDACLCTGQNTHWHQPLFSSSTAKLCPNGSACRQRRGLPSTFSTEYVRRGSGGEGDESGISTKARGL